jgi:hypothetical protein
MRLRATTLLLGTAVLLVGSASAAAPRATLAVAPTPVHRGALVYIRGNAGDCPVHDSVTVISRAFPRTHEFAGVPAVLTPVRLHHLFRASTRIPSTKAPGRYVVTARCGGGTFGVAAHITVLP